LFLATGYAISTAFQRSTIATNQWHERESLMHNFNSSCSATTALPVAE